MSLYVGAVGLKVNTSPTENSRFGVLFENKFGKGEAFGWYYGAIVYNFLSGKLRTRKTYGDGYMVIAAAAFHKWSMDQKPTASDRDVN